MNLRSDIKKAGVSVEGPLSHHAKSPHHLFNVHVHVDSRSDSVSSVVASVSFQYELFESILSASNPECPPEPAAWGGHKGSWLCSDGFDTFQKTASYSY